VPLSEAMAREETIRTRTGIRNQEGRKFSDFLLAIKLKMLRR
jgi:hypothetical protein